MAPRPGLTVKKVLDEAILLADRVGFENLSWAQLASTLGVRPPSLYNHMASLEELRGKIALEGVKQLHATLSSAVQTLRGAEALQVLGRAYIQFARQHPGLYEASIRAPAADATELLEMAAKVVDLIFDVLTPYGFSRSRGIHVVRTFRSILHGFASIEARGGFGLPESLDTTIETLLAIFVGGLDALEEKES